MLTVAGSSDNRLLITPKQGSQVIVADLSGGDDRDLLVLAYSEIETIDLRIGLSADEMTRELRQFLVHPDKLFRRVRDEHGNLVLSKRAAEFHPSQGVYRSPYQNQVVCNRTKNCIFEV